MKESKIQQHIIGWWKLAHRGLNVSEERLLMAFPLQGIRSPISGARMKAEGMRAGTPDLLLAVARGGFHGLWLELKTADGTPTESQVTMLSILREQGYDANLVYGFEQCQRAIVNYLSVRAE